jgi:hypothetical protein
MGNKSNLFLVLSTVGFLNWAASPSGDRHRFGDEREESHLVDTLPRGPAIGDMLVFQERDSCSELPEDHRQRCFEKDPNNNALVERLFRYVLGGFARALSLTMETLVNWFGSIATLTKLAK